MFSSGLALSFSAAGFEPVGGGEAGGFAGFHAGQAGEDVFEVVTRVDPETAAVLDEGVEDGGFFSGVFGSDEGKRSTEHLSHFCQRSGPYGIYATRLSMV